MIINIDEIAEIKSMKFSPNGKFILLGSSENVMLLIDAYEGN